MRKAVFCILLAISWLNLFAQIKADDLDGNNTSACYTSGGYCQKPFQPMTNNTVNPPDTYNIVPGNVSKNISIKNLLYSSTTSQATKDSTKVFAHLLGWFCVQSDSLPCEGHVQVGYNSDDPNPNGTVDTQLKDMRARGFDGVVIDWYGAGGPRNQFDPKLASIQRINRTAQAVQQIISSIPPCNSL